MGAWIYGLDRREPLRLCTTWRSGKIVAARALPAIVESVFTTRGGGRGDMTPRRLVERYLVRSTNIRRLMKWLEWTSLMSQWAVVWIQAPYYYGTQEPLVYRQWPAFPMGEVEGSFVGWAIGPRCHDL